MKSISAALEHILGSLPSGRTARVPLGEAHGRVLAESIVAPADVPAWDNSAMDGFAVCIEDCPGVVRVVETVAAGAVPTRAVRAGMAVAVMTGAPVPSGTEAVVMREDTAEVTDGVMIRTTARMGQHIRRRGSDIRAGDVVFAPGRVLTPQAVGVLAGLGLTEVSIGEPPKVAILSTGDEVIAPGKPLEPGQLYSSNSSLLFGLAADAGARPIDMGIVRDDREALRIAFERAASEADLVVCTGGVSVGDFDHVKAVLGEVQFWRVAMKPGKPLAFGRVNGTPFFGLPGNPVSAFVNFLQFVRPSIRTLLGDPNPFLPVIRAQLEGVHRREPGRLELVRVRMRREGGRLVATAAGGHQGSGNLRGSAEAHGFMFVAAEVGSVEGEVDVQVFDWGFEARSEPGYPVPGVGPSGECC